MSENYDGNGQFLGAAMYPLDTVKYFEFSFKGNGDREDTCFYVLPLLAEHLRDNHAELTVLDLENRMLDDKQALPVIEALKGNTTVKELKLGRNMMDLALLELSEILKTNQTITKVDVRQNDINEAAAIGFAEMLMCNTTIVELNLSSNHVASAAKHLAVALPMNSTLTNLYVEDCWIEDKEAELLLAALGKNSSITEFRGSNNRCDKKDVRKQLRSWAR